MQAERPASATGPPFRPYGIPTATLMESKRTLHGLAFIKCNQSKLIFRFINHTNDYSYENLVKINKTHAQRIDLDTSRDHKLGRKS